MKITLDELFANSFVISIDDSRLGAFYGCFRRCFGNRILPRRFKGYAQPGLEGTYKCMLSHAAVVRMSKCMGFPFVTIFEDDAFPRPDAEALLSRFMLELPECKIAMLGWNKYESVKPLNGSFNALSGWAWGSHAYVLFESAYDSYISEHNRNPKRVADDFFQFYGRETVLPRENLFIQYNVSKSMNGYSGYTYDNVAHPKPPDGFLDFEGLVERVDDGKTLESEMRKMGKFAYRINGGNAGDFVIASAEFRFFDSLGLEYDVITTENKRCIISNDFNLVYGGGGGWMTNYRSGYTMPLNDYFRNRHLKKCIVLPSSFYGCDDVVSSFDDRFVVFCRDRKSFEYCIRKNSRAKFYLHDDMAIGLDVGGLLMDDEVLSKRVGRMRKAYEGTRRYIKMGYDVAEFVRTDSERTIPVTARNYDLSNIYGAWGEDISREDADEVTSIMLNTINHYDEIKTNRLHIMISAHLLGKKVDAYDNSYGKLSAVYNMSLKGDGNITMHGCVAPHADGSCYPLPVRPDPLPKSMYGNPYFMGAYKP